MRLGIVTASLQLTPQQDIEVPAGKTLDMMEKERDARIMEEADELGKVVYNATRPHSEPPLQLSSLQEIIDEICESRVQGELQIALLN